MNKKILIGSIIGTAILLLPSTLAIEQECLNQNEPLPDLVPEYFRFFSEFAGSIIPDYAYFFFKNIGETHVYRKIPLNISIVRSLFGRYKIKTTFKAHHMYQENDGIAPNESGSWWFGSCDKITPKYGFYQFNANINYNQSIEESNYENNLYSAKYLYIFGFYIYIRN